MNKTINKDTIREAAHRERERYISYYKSRAKALRAVHLTTKADGTPYQNYTKNFTVDEGVQAWWEKGNGQEQTLHLKWLNPKDPTAINTLEVDNYQNIEEGDPSYDALKQEGRVVHRAYMLKDYYVYTPSEFLEELEVLAK